MTTPICVVGLRPLKDFHAALLADNLARAGVPARAVELDLDVDRVDVNALGLARAVRPPRGPLARRGAARGAAAAARARRLPRGARPAHAHERHARDSRRSLGAPGVRGADAAAVGARACASTRSSCAALRAAGGRIIVGSEVVGAEPDATGVTVRAQAAAREVEHRADWLVLATGGFAEGSITLGSDWRARETVLDLPLAHLPGPGEPRFVPDYFDDQPMARAGVAVDAGLRPVGPDGARVHERVLVAGASIGGAVPWKEHSGEGISVTTGFHAAGQIPGRDRIRRRPRGMTAHEDDVLLDLVRGSLDHCVKCTICETHCPYSNVTPLFPGPKYVGPQAERFRTGEEVSPDASVDFCSSCGICTRSARRACTSPRSTRARRPSSPSRAAIPLRNQLLGRPDKLGALGTPVAPLANWSLHNRPLRALAHRLLGIHRDAAAPPLRGPDVPALGEAHTPPAQATKEVVLFHGCGTNYYEPELGREDRRDPRAQRLPRHDPEAGLLRPAAAVQRHLPRGPRLRSPARASAGAARPPGRADRRTAHELHAHAQARGARDPRPRRGPRRRASSPSTTWDITEFLLDLHDRGELRTDFVPVEETVAYHAPCQQQGHNIGKPALDLFALIPGLDDGRDGRRAAAASPARTG